MSKRTDKKRQKRFNEVHPTTTAPAAQPVVETAAPTAEPVPHPGQRRRSHGQPDAPALPGLPGSHPPPEPVPQPEVTVTETTAPVNAAPAYDLFIQYQNGEYDAAVLAEKILDKCKTEGIDSSDLKIYVKPEDKKAYYACAGGTGAIELA